MVENKDLFSFDIVEDNLSQHGKNAVKLNILLSLENLNFYKQSLKLQWAELQEKANLAYEKEKRIIAISKSNNQSILESEIIDLSIIINEIQDNLRQHVATLPKNVLETLENLNIYLSHQGLEKNFKDLHAFIFHFVDSVDFQFSRIEKLYDGIGKLEGRNLEAVVRFRSNSFTTNFTRYYLNLEEFGDILNAILAEEINNKFFRQYKKLENYFFQLAEYLNFPEKIKVSQAIQMSQKLLNILDMLNKFKFPLLNAQRKYKTIISENIYSLDSLAFISNKYLEIFKILYQQTNDKTHCLRAMSYFHELTLNSFLDLDDEQILRTIDFIKKFPPKMEINELLLPLIGFFDPGIEERIKKGLINQFKKDNDYKKLDYSQGYMIKKAPVQYFSNNKFYSHIVALFKFYENEEFQNNKYNAFSAVDKISLDEKLFSKKGKVFSKFFNKEIEYRTYYSVKINRINVTSYDELNLKNSA